MSDRSERESEWLLKEGENGGIRRDRASDWESGRWQSLEMAVWCFPVTWAVLKGVQIYTPEMLLVSLVLCPAMCVPVFHLLQHKSEESFPATLFCFFFLVFFFCLFFLSNLITVTEDWAHLKAVTWVGEHQVRGGALLTHRYMLSWFSDENKVAILCWQPDYNLSVDALRTFSRSG